VDSEGSQAVKAQLRLRELILSGDLEAGERIAELAIVERLGMSRTPIRAALMRLEQEGLLEKFPGGGYKVRTFSERDVADAIEMRGTVEGLAARLAAERGEAAADAPLGTGAGDAHSATPSAWATVKMSLSPRPDMQMTIRWSFGFSGAIFIA
jgi:DNA-binding GntR family transcriptional regulator